MELILVYYEFLNTLPYQHLFKTLIRVQLTLISDLGVGTLLLQIPQSQLRQ